MSIVASEMSDNDFNMFLDQAYQLAGIKMHASKRDLVIGRLTRRVRELKLPSLAAYRRYLEDNMLQEKGRFINAITTNLTSFFRERHHFEYLRDWATKEHLGEIRVWNAGCSTGQESYSTAITMSDIGALSRCTIKATDIDTDCLDTARKAEYRISDIEDFDLGMKKRHFWLGDGANLGNVKVKNNLQDVVEFTHLNLMEEWESEEKFHVIFCRNVFIYFDDLTQQALLKKFAERLVPSGILFLGHSETIKTDQELFLMKGRTVYRRSLQ